MDIKIIKNKADIIIEHLGSDYTLADAVTLGLISDYIFGWNRPYQYYDLPTYVGSWVLLLDVRLPAMSVETRRMKPFP